MTVHDLETEWGHVERAARARWAKLTDEDLGQINGNADQLVTRLQDRYHYSRQIVLAELGDFLAHTP